MAPRGAVRAGYWHHKYLLHRRAQRIIRLVPASAGTMLWRIAAFAALGGFLFGYDLGLMVGFHAPKLRDECHHNSASHSCGWAWAQWRREQAGCQDRLVLA